VVQKKYFFADNPFIILISLSEVSPCAVLRDSQRGFKANTILSIANYFEINSQSLFKINCFVERNYCPLSIYANYHVVQITLNFSNQTSWFANGFSRHTQFYPMPIWRKIRALVVYCVQHVIQFKNFWPFNFVFIER